MFEPSLLFWDNLSKYVLSASTLREFDRRTNAAGSYPHHQTHISRPTTLRHLSNASADGAAQASQQFILDPPGTPINTSHVEVSEATGPEISSKIAYTAAWEQHMIDHSIYPPRYHRTQKPANLGDIQTRLKRRRPSLVQSRFSDDDFPEFEKNNEKAKSKSSALTLVFSTFIGKRDIPHVQNSSFQNIRHLTDGSIPMPRPEFYDGAHASELLDF